MQFIDLKTQQKRIESRLNQRFQTIFQHGQFILGPEVAEFEAQLANWVGVKHGIGVSNGSDALWLALMALDIRPGMEVITTPFSFFSTAGMISVMGATPVFVDIDPATFNIDAQLVEAAITPRTRAIIVVNLYGQCADFDALYAIAARHNVAIIEDAAQSLGALYRGRRSGSLGKISCTSFFPSKPLGCYGDGGACFTDDDTLAKKLRELANHGQDRRYHHVRLGLNARLDTLQAAVLLEKLAIFPEEIALRQTVAARYEKLLNGLVELPQVAPYNTSVYAQYTIQVDERDRVQQMLQARGVPTAVHYPVALHQQPVYQDQPFAHQRFIHAERASRRVISLPFHAYLTAAEQEQVAAALADALVTAAV